jgi:hypothetical protein
MAAKGKAILYGFLIWLAAFVVAFLIFPLRESSRPLFESIMPVVVTSATAFFAVMYLRGVKTDYLREGIVLGCLWLAINVLIDLPLMLVGGPMKMTLGQYVADIGLTYLVIPAVTIGIGLGCEQVSTTKHATDGLIDGE